MKAIIYFSLSKDKNAKRIANSFDGDKYEIENCKNNVKFYPFQLLLYGFLTVSRKKVCIKKLDINFDLYDEIYLITPIWAGQPSAFMRQFLSEYNIEGKTITLIGTCKGGYKKFFTSFKALLPHNNTISKQLIYIGDQFKEEVK